LLETQFNKERNTLWRDRGWRCDR